jgi:hypothetical protein
MLLPCQLFQIVLPRGSGQQLLLASELKANQSSSIPTNGILKEKIGLHSHMQGHMKPMKDNTCNIFLNLAGLNWYQTLSIEIFFSKNIELYLISVYSICIEALKIIFLKSL